MSELSERMRADWDRRAKEDAKYYAGFGRRGQSDEEFFATAALVIHSNLERELKWIAAGKDKAGLKALEIGCGPGRLMLPMSRHFGEIHGVDISEEMVRLAREKLAGIPHAFIHRTNGTDLAGFTDETFDFVYSYAVFQHIPSREVVFGYLQEARRVLKEGGLLRCQFNGLPATVAHYDTWNGARIAAQQILDFCRDNDFQLLALEGVSTQYMWVTARKRPIGWSKQRAARQPEQSANILRITSTQSSEPVLPCNGRFASLSLWVEDLPEQCDLLGLKASIAEAHQYVSYIGPPSPEGWQQVNVALSSPISTGLASVRLWWLGEPLSQEALIRVVPPGPMVPRVVSVCDGVNLLAGTRISSGYIKVTVEEMDDIRDFAASVGGKPIENIDSFCVDPLPPRYEINLHMPPDLPPGPHLLEIQLGRRKLPPIVIELV